jgi:DNA-binding IscR family transcriptional regulator
MDLPQQRQRPRPAVRRLSVRREPGLLGSRALGPRGGFELAREPDRITLLDVVQAIEGREPTFLCREIRQRGPFGGEPASFRQPCVIAGMLAEAEQSWQRSLMSRTLADLASEVQRTMPDLPEQFRSWLLEETDTAAG